MIRLRTVATYLWLAGSVSPLAALECSRIDAPRLDFRLTATLTVAGDPIPMSIEGSRRDVAIVRLRANDGTIDQLSEMRDFVPARTINGLNGESQTFSLRPVSGSISGFEPGAEANYEQTVFVNGKPLRTEKVTQRVTGEASVTISGCPFHTLRIMRAFIDKMSNARRVQEFDYAPALGYPLWMRIEAPSPSGPVIQIIQVTGAEIDIAS